MVQITTIVSAVSVAAIALLAVLLVFFLIRYRRAGTRLVSLLDEIKEGPRDAN